MSTTITQSSSTLSQISPTRKYINSYGAGSPMKKSIQPALVANSHVGQPPAILSTCHEVQAVHQSSLQSSGKTSVIEKPSRLPVLTKPIFSRVSPRLQNNRAVEFDARKKTPAPAVSKNIFSKPLLQSGLTKGTSNRQAISGKTSITRDICDHIFGSPVKFPELSPKQLAKRSSDESWSEEKRFIAQHPSSRYQDSGLSFRERSKALMERLDLIEEKSRREMERRRLRKRSSVNPISHERVERSHFWYLGDIVLEPIRVLGRGASGTVLSARDVQGRWLRGNDKEVAVKILSRDCHEFFLREIEFMQGLGPDGLSTRLFATAQTDEHRILIISKETTDLYEICAGLPFNQRRIREQDCKRIIKDLIELTDAMHSRGFVHFDLKPENILVNREGELVLCDGSLAATWAEIKSEKFFMRGTPGYMAPEVVDAKPLKHPRAADMYSIGAILVWLRDVALPTTAVDSLDLDDISEEAFPSHRYPTANNFLTGLLWHDPSSRLTVEEAYEHPWLADVILGASSLPWCRAESSLSPSEHVNLDVLYKQIRKVNIYV